MIMLLIRRQKGLSKDEFYCQYSGMVQIKSLGLELHRDSVYRWPDVGIIIPGFCRQTIFPSAAESWKGPKRNIKKAQIPGSL